MAAALSLAAADPAVLGPLAPAAWADAALSYFREHAWAARTATYLPDRRCHCPGCSMARRAYTAATERPEPNRDRVISNLMGALSHLLELQTEDGDLLRDAWANAQETYRAAEDYLDGRTDEAPFDVLDDGEWARYGEDHG